MTRWPGLFERLKFLSITASNLDEFFMIRVASLKDMVHAGYSKKDISGMTAPDQMELRLMQSQLSSHLSSPQHRAFRDIIFV